MANAELIAAIRSGLRTAADPARAAGAQAYMKSDMPSLGVRVPEVRRIVRTAARELPPASLEDLKSTVLELWRNAPCREERYAAIDLTGLRRCSGRVQHAAGVRGDHPQRGLVGLGGRRVTPAPWAAAGPRPEMAAELRRWSKDGDFWIRRASITAQLGAKSATDTALLGDVILANLADREFFIRKAIGWALRDYSATDPDWVRTFVDRHRTGLSPLSAAEALRKLPR